MGHATHKEVSYCKEQRRDCTCDPGCHAHLKIAQHHVDCFTDSYSACGHPWLWLSSLFPHLDFHPCKENCCRHWDKASFCCASENSFPTPASTKASGQTAQVEICWCCHHSTVFSLLQRSESPLVIQSPQTQHLWYHLFFHNCFGCACEVASVVSDFLWSTGLWPIRLFCPWDSPGKNTGVTCHALLQR